MRFKRVLALVMSASLLVSAPLLDAQTVFATEVVETELTTETVESTEDAEVTEAAESTEAAGAETETTESESLTLEGNETVEDDNKTYEETVEEKVMNPEDMVPAETSGVQRSEEFAPFEAMEEVTENTEASEETENAGPVKVTEISRDSITADLYNNSTEVNAVTELLNEKTVSDEDMVRVIIVMDGDSIIEKDSDATMNFFTKVQSKLLENKQDSVINKIEDKVLDGETLEVRYHYTWLLNGIAAEIPYGMIDEIEAVKGVEDVILQPVYEVAEEAVTPYTITDGVMIGRESTWADGYTGKGIKISIIDTGIDDDHQNFGPLSEECLTEDSATKDSISSVLGTLNASELYEGLTVDDVYRSTKIAYGFNYVDENLQIDHSKDTQGDHGTHVAGIAAANELDNGEAVGVAPDAQLYVMKVFGKNGGAYTDDLLAAVEDSLKLGADVINMSLGSPAGFTSGGEKLDEIYGRVSDTNTILAVAAGNSATSGQGNLWGTNTNLTSNPDNSTISSPATYVNATSVASVDNVASKEYYVEVNGEKLGYTEGEGGTNGSMVETLGGQSFAYAMVDNFGQTAEDFTEAGVEGKVAVVQRGINAFAEKVKLAEDAGAIACLIYNNTSGTIAMDLSQGSSSTIPCASITMKSGELLKAVLEEKPESTMAFSDKKEVVPSETAYRMSEFSSWGVSPDLSLEPEVTAPGGNIYSTRDKGTYGLMSGTSMASPNMAGVSALVMQYAKENFKEMSETDLHFFVNGLIMSTAEPLTYDETVMFSPRSQGAGLANAYNAVKTEAFLSVDDMDVPKAEVKDDPEKTGSYSYSFNVHNFGEKTLYYELDTNAQTEDYIDDTEEGGTGRSFMATTPIVLDAVTAESSANLIYTYDYNASGAANTADARMLYLNVKGQKAVDANEAFRYDLDGNETSDMKDVQEYLDALVGKTDTDANSQILKVEAGKDAKVTVSVQVTDAGKAWMDTHFENGIYVEGYTFLTAKNAGGVDLSLPYMGFYGDWTKAPIIDSGFYYDSDEEFDGSQFINMIATNYGTDIWMPGVNPYINEKFDESHISVSPNEDGYGDYFSNIFLSLMRNANVLSFTYTDADTGEVYFDEGMEKVAKSYYASAYGMILPFVYSWYVGPEGLDDYYFTDKDGNYLENNTKVNFAISAELDYYEHESNNEFSTWNIPVTVDTEAPTAKILTNAVQVDEETGNHYVELELYDNVDVAAVNFLNKSGTMILAQYPVSEDGVYDVTGFGKEFIMVVGDYAFNESVYYITAEDNDPILDDSLLYGYRVFDAEYGNDMMYGWIGIDPETAETAVFDTEYYMDYALTAAEYIGGYILAVDANNALCFIKPGYWDERTQIAELGVKIRELAFDPTTRTLYGYNSSDLTLCSIDITTGEVTNISAMYGLSTVIAMTCDDDGNLYGINTSAELHKIDKETGTWGELIVNMYDTIGFNPYYAQSMTWDSEKDCIYWTAYNYSNMGIAGSLYQIDLKAETIVPEEIGTVGGEAEVVGLLKLDAKGFELQEAEITSIDIKQDSVTMLKDYGQNLDLVQTPWYGTEEEFSWTSDNPKVVTVDDTGHLVATGVGQATVTVRNAAGNLKASCDVSVVDPQAEFNGFVMSGETLFNQWVNFEVDDMDNFKPVTKEDYLSFYAGEYCEGSIYAYSASSELYKINAETKVAKKISEASSDFIMQDMAYNYADGYMYGLMQSMLDGCTYLVTIDLMNGDYNILCLIEDEYYNPGCGLAISKEGTIYVVTYTGMLYTMDDVETGEMTRVGYTGYSGSSYTQCMAFDHNEGEGNDELYWAMITGEGAVSIAYVDTRNGAALPLGTMDGGVQLTAMYSVPEAGIIPAREKVEVESISLKNGTSVFRMLEGSTKAAPISVLPYNAQDRSLTWSVKDESIVEVDADNMIIAKQPGTTTVTVGKDGVESVTFEVEVLESAGNLYGYVLTDLASYDGQFWGTFKDYDLSAGEALAYDSSYELYAGAYYNGKVYGYGVDEDTYESLFMVVDATNNKFTLEKTITGEFPDMRDMAFDYSQGAMYGVGGVRNVEGNNSLYAIDLESGTAYELAKLDTTMSALACSTDGILYGIDTYGALYTINKENGELALIGETGYTANLYQSMTYDHNTGNLYWAQICRDNFTWTVNSGLMLVDTDTADVLNLGYIGTAGCMVTALYTVPEHEITVGTPDVSKVLVSNQSDVLKIGETTQITATPYPVSISTSGVELTFESTNEEVATVDSTGLVTAAGAGTAEIVVKAGTVEAHCEIKVVDPEKVMYAVNANGWEVTPVLDADMITGTVTLPETAGFSIATATYNTNDGYFYAVDTNGYLWKYTEDLGTIEKIGTEALVEKLPDTVVTDGYSTPVVVDIVGNPYDGKLYAMIEPSWGYYYLFEVNVVDGTLSLVMEIPEDVGLADEFVFTSEDDLLIYDTMVDYVRTLNISDGSYGQLAWAQSIMTSGDNIGMAYSEELNLVFIATDDTWYHNGMTLFLLNPETGKIWEYSEAAYSSMVDLIIIENSTPAVTPEAAEEAENSENAEENETSENEDVTVPAEAVLPETEAAEETEEAVEETVEETEAAEASEKSEATVESETTEE